MVARYAGVGYVRRMQRPFHPRSRGFRVVLAMALLAWAMLAWGATAMPMQMDGAIAAASAQPADPHASAAGCDGLQVAHTAPHRDPVPPPMGSGDCCHGGCHCLSACNAVLAVPRFVVAGPWSHAAFPVAAPADPVPVPGAPPLRPPIA